VIATHSLTLMAWSQEPIHLLADESPYVIARRRVVAYRDLERCNETQ
jgi:hypothetical protein